MKPNLIIQASVFSRSGYGAHARDIVTSLFKSNRFNISVLPTGWGGTSTTDNISLDDLDTLMFCINNKIVSKDFVFIHLGIPPEFRRVGPINIGITAGIESDNLPAGWAEACNQMNAVIVPSVFVKNLFQQHGVTVPVYAVGEGVDIGIFNNKSGVDELSFPVSTSFNFMTAGQWMVNPIGEDRKQIGLLLKWFCEVFENQQDVGIFVKTFSQNNSSPDLYFTRERIEDIKKGKPFPKVYLLHGDMTDQELAQLHQKSKAFVLATSGEGFGRTIAEAIACDSPVLVTGWSGHMDFVLPEFSTLFDYDMVDVPFSVLQQGIYQPGMYWAFPKEQDVKRKLKRCYENYSIAKTRAIKHGEAFRKTWSKDITGTKLVEVVSQIVANPYIKPNINQDNIVEIV
ncbi:MAG: glycosyltransferase [Candidatus Omnitrophica bacterium]|jgi:hypothetical protein|nr:glycosyltransferase [Candidatus Omnitrophota bacterium]